MAIIDRLKAGALIPTKESNQIIKATLQQSVAMQLMKKLPNMSTAQEKMPVLSALVSAGFVSGDIGLKMTTDAAWKNKVITAEEIAAIVPIPEAVLDDSNYDIWGELSEPIQAAIGAVWDGAVFQSIDKPDTWPEGIINGATAATKVVTAGTGRDIVSDISAAKTLNRKQGYKSTGIVTGTTLAGELEDLRDDNGQPIFVPALTESGQDRVLGVPFMEMVNGVWDDTKALAVVGDFQQAVWAVRQDITVKLLDQAVISDADGKVIYNLAQQDMVALRVVFRGGWQLPNPITQLSPNYDDTTRYPFAIVTEAPTP